MIQNLCNNTRNKMKLKFLLTLFLIFNIIVGNSQTLQPNSQVRKVYVIFKTHLDVGFTNLSSVVTQRYIHEFIPKAIDVAEKMKSDGSGDRYVWTTGSWLIWKYLQEATEEDIKRLDKAIQEGDIIWNAVPYTVESETMNRDLFNSCSQLSKELDRKYGKHTIAAKMTDVPGHTRGIIAPLTNAGIRFLHIGVNSACPVPDVPPFCRWKDSKGNELILAYQQDYGEETLLPNEKTVISINFTGDNHGPHQYEDVKRIYANIRKRYPNAEITGASLNDVAEVLWSMRNDLPIITSEIGDTWIYGYGGSPIRMAKFRTLSRLFSRWENEGKFNSHEKEKLNFAAVLGLIAEHTQGVDVKTHLRHWDAYNMDTFKAFRAAELFSKAEQSWKEIDAYIGSAITLLPPSLQKEAIEEVAKVDQISLKDIKENTTLTDWHQSLMKGFQITGLSYQMFNQKDYDKFQKNYMRTRPEWGIADLGKPGLENSEAISATLNAQITKQSTTKEKEGIRTVSELKFPFYPELPSGVYPERIQTETWISNNGKQAEVSCTLFRKPAVRLPEAYWLSFNADNIISIIAEKTGERVDVMDVVEKGNRQMHGIDRYIDLVTTTGTYRIWSKEAFLVNIGEADGLNYSTSYPDIRNGIHFNLSNNLWGTNFSMWWEGSITFHFKIEKLDNSFM